MEGKRNTVLLVVIAIATLLVAVVGATFAYFASTKEVENNLTVQAVTGKAASFTAYGSDSISLNITSVAMQKGAENENAIATDTGNLVVTYVSGSSDEAMSCTYDVLYVWDGEPVGTEVGTEEDPITSWAYTAVSNGQTLPYTSENPEGTFPYEFSLLGSATVTGSDASSVPYGTTGSGYLVADTEKNFTDYSNDGEKTLTIIKDAVISTSDTTEGVTITYNFVANFYNLPFDQSELADKTFDGHFEVDARC